MIKLDYSSFQGDFFRVKTYPDAITMHEKTTKHLFLGDTPGRDWDWISGCETGLHDVALAVDSFDWDYNLKRLWIPKTRWNLMVRQYIDPVDLERAVFMVGDRLQKKGRGISVLRTKTVPSRMGGARMRRRWGSCMLNMTYRNNPYPTITLNSRTSYFGYLAALDINVAHNFARLCGEQVGVDVREMRFVWHLHLAQYHGVRSLAWPMGNEKYAAFIRRELPNRFKYRLDLSPGTHPGIRKTLNAYERIDRVDREGLKYGDEKFAATARLRRRYHSEVMGETYAAQFVGSDEGHAPSSNSKALLPLADTWCRDLDFSCILPGGVGRDDDTDDDEEDDDDE